MCFSLICGYHKHFHHHHRRHHHRHRHHQYQQHQQLRDDGRKFMDIVSACKVKDVIQIGNQEEESNLIHVRMPPSTTNETTQQDIFG
jgi:hypothetical protein